METVSDYLYEYQWRQYMGMPACGGFRKGMTCQVLVWGRKNSALVQFEDGYRAVTSRSALRRRWARRLDG